MWLMTIYGFFSATSAKYLDGSMDSRRIQVRARVREHLENLQARFPALAKAKIRESDDTDYAYRIVVARKLWADIALQLADETCWTNFKTAVASHGWTEAEYCRALGAVWSVMYRLQPPRYADDPRQPWFEGHMEKKIIGASVSAVGQGALVGHRPPPKPIVEDTSVVGGTDSATNAPVIRPRAADGLAEGGTDATDPQERR